MATYSNCALGPNSTENDHLNANTGLTLNKEYIEKRVETVIVESDNALLRTPQDDLKLIFGSENVGLPLQNEGDISLAEPCNDVDDNLVQLELKDKGHSEPPNVSLTRVLRPRKQKSSESPVPYYAAGTDNCDNVEVNSNCNTMKRKEKQRKHIAVDEFSRIRAKLRYFLHRIKYEQNLIDAYSTEGWKGQSLEKIKPEKELQRAKSGIFNYKLKIRDLFQCIDMLLAQGRLPESSYDYEGLINSEDIFCAKCSSKDLAVDNDIILCDGACERGFHQLCLEPPLLKAEIPPGDEAWLCPGCVCKLDCFVLLNQHQGTNLSLTDSWEKVFPGEAATATGVKRLDDISGLPSDDSEDDDYNPANNLEVEENVSDDESASSEESDYFSAPEDLEEQSHIDDLDVTCLPSEDSEDEDYDPDVPGDDDAQVMRESSSSDFTSDSEDVGPIINQSGYLSHEQLGNIKIGGGAGEHSSNDEPPCLQSNDKLVSGERHPEQDKMLHDGICQSTSPNSGDREYGCTATKRKDRNLKANEKSCDQTRNSDANTSFSQIENKNTTRRKNKKRQKVEGLATSKNGSSSKRIGKSKYGEDAIKRLYECFKENQYPKRDVKEKLASELGLAIQQVHKWFENARWSFNHSSNNQKQGSKPN
ncbi:hypothetical protein DM860_003186 [Cuscuta australis]|uniref:PHD-type domain-containing protein n=1 Tax=Cuscuta australis TaxID=267555 RepID=A0A328D6V1_9ASTE|nr:hypothetical protein DM860_003186 [Cuscuta australis]